jgi:YwiC-like protein
MANVTPLESTCAAVISPQCYGFTLTRFSLILLGKLYRMAFPKNSPVSEDSVHPGAGRLKSVALPVEHGGWGLVVEPLLLGIFVAPSGPGFLLVVGTIAVFLARQPIKLLARDRRHHRRLRRTVVAQRFALGYTAVALIAFLIALSTSSRVFVLPLLIAMPFALVQLVYDTSGRSRELLPELSGATAMAALSASIALSGGWQIVPALSLWAVLASTRVLPSIVYVRTRLRKNHGKQVSVLPALVAHLFGCVLVGLLFRAGLAPRLALAVAGLLLLRAAFFLSHFSPKVSARQLGLSEVGFGLVTVLALVLGYRFAL